jgi:RNA polymerase sigma-70 factor (ECF subfamily)
LLKILHNAFFNRRARERHSARGAAPDALEQAEDPRADGAAIAPPELDYDRVDEEVKSAIDDLRPEFKSVLVMWATMDLSYQQIADILGIPIGTVMSRLHRARQQLAQTLHDFARENRLVLAASTP